MKNSKCRRRALCFLLIAAMAAGGAGRAPAENAPAYYVENDWNFADGEMDIRSGIPENAAGALGRIERSGVLRVAVSPENGAPYVFRDAERAETGGCGGADIRLAEMIAEKMGVRLEIVPMDSTEILPALAEEQCDLVLSGLAYTPGRARAFTLSGSYYEPEVGDTIGVILPEDSAVEVLADLENRVIAAQSSTIPEAFAARHAVGYREFFRTASVQEVFEAVAEGRADAGFVSISGAETYLKNNPGRGLKLAEGLRFSPDSQYAGLRAAARKGETQLIYFVNGVIREAAAQNLYEAWIADAEKRAKELGF